MKKIVKKIVSLLFSDEIESVISELATSRIKSTKEVVSNSILKKIIDVLPDANETAHLKKINPIDIRYQVGFEKNDDHLRFITLFLKRIIRSTREGRIIGIIIGLKYEFFNDKINTRHLYIPLRHLKYKMQHDYDNIDVETYFWDLTSVLIPVEDESFDYFLRGVRKFASGHYQKFYKHVASNYLLSEKHPKIPSSFISFLMSEYKVNSVNDIILLAPHPDWGDEIKMGLKDWEYYFQFDSTKIKKEKLDFDDSLAVRITFDEKCFIGFIWEGEMYLFMKKEDYPYQQEVY